MDYSTIILIIIFCITVYFIYTYLVFTSIIINKPVDLKVSAGSRLSYDATKMKTPGSTRYYYETWIWIDSNFPVDTSNVIFNRDNYLVFVLKGSKLSLFSGGAVDAKGIYTTGDERIVYTTSFPFQKWVQIVLSVDGSVCDAYLDGKLIKTTTNWTPTTDSTKNITAGNIYTIGQINNFNYWPNTIDPQTVWNKYIQGNGQYGFTKYFQQYKVDFSLSQGNDQLYNFSIL